jgi:hypothetical protein
VEQQVLDELVAEVEHLLVVVSQEKAAPLE